ncbi:MAG: hypothetical protein HQ557_03905 [Bacteroidetes bacterium]|nr:hypothetical protein [Bacteroidota bacterium]
MPWKTILIIFISALFILFIAFNVENNTNISFIFFTVSSVPVYLIVFFSTLLGALCMIPVLIRKRMSGKNNEQNHLKEKEIEDSFKKAVQGASKTSNENSSKTKKRKTGKKKNVIEDIDSVSDIDILR